MQYEPRSDTPTPAYPVSPSVQTQWENTGYVPTSPAAGYPQMYGPKAPRKVWPFLLAAVVALVAFAGVGWFVYDQFIRTDSGIAACEAMAADKKVGNGTADGTFTEQEYRDARAIFTESRHEDIEAAGVKMVDLLWQLEQVDTDNDLAAALLYGQRATDAMGEMTTACANHGIVVKFAD